MNSNIVEHEIFYLIANNIHYIDIDAFRNVEPSPIGYISAIKEIPKMSERDIKWNNALRSVLPNAKLIKYHWRLRILAALMDRDDVDTDNLEILKLPIVIRQVMKEKGLTQINSLEEVFS